MVLPYSDKITRVPPYSFVSLVPHKWFRVRGYHPLRRHFPESSAIKYAITNRPNPISLAATNRISVDFFSSCYWDVSLRTVRLYINVDNIYLYMLGCPIRKSPDQSFLAAPRGLSQPSTSFIASTSLGIHLWPLVTFFLICVKCHCLTKYKTVSVCCSFLMIVNNSNLNNIRLLKSNLRYLKISKIKLLNLGGE